MTTSAEYQLRSRKREITFSLESLTNQGRLLHTMVEVNLILHLESIDSRSRPVSDEKAKSVPGNPQVHFNRLQPRRIDGLGVIMGWSNTDM